MKTIDLSTWKRLKHFHFFNGLDYPHFNLTTHLDVTELRDYCKKTGQSFFRAVLYLTVRAANEVENFRLRIRGGEVVLHDSVHPSYTSMTEEQVFSFTDVQFDTDPRVFFQNCDKAESLVKNEASLEDDPNRDDYLFMSAIPWVSFTSFVHPVHMNPVDSVPRISWGKYFEDFNGWKLPVCVQAHHALVDGWEMGLYFKRLQELMDMPEEVLGKE